ncbi:BTAD domain-containing putative transcriptional regulator [Actinomadura rugatobispora]|uniref:BTAD domain-containing putative transcriptional regulator n=1 Tax=Actinomadura rugatobispora TaxID=1994 RepID=A0ABW0ZL77_9ACTN|nr:transcriptional regulator AfsR [Actinomadura rugatobispora]
MDTPGLRFAVLGPVRAWRGPAELDLGGPQQRAVLAVLLLNRGRTMPIDGLLDALWGDLPPARAVGTVRTYASRLRRVLENDRANPEILVSTGKGYALRAEPGTLDAEVFEARTAEAGRAQAAGDPVRARELYGQALDLWDGAPLPGLPGPYLQARRTRLAERRLAVLQARLEADLELGRHAEIVGELALLSGEHPLREPLRGLLMLALYRCGRQAEALAAYTSARRTLAGELGIDPGPGLRDLQERILRNDPSLTAPARREKDDPAPAPSQGRPFQRPASLPADLPDFTGRAALADRMTGWLARREGTAPAVIAVSGVGGVGKTALAVHVAHAVRDAYPDGQLYVDLLGTAKHPLPPAVVLGEFLRALGVPDQSVPEGEHERSALFRSMLADRRVLVLLDNARDAEQVRPLLPGTTGCAALVTSRPRLSGLPGARAVDLDVLDPVEAIALFTAIVGSRAAAERGAVVDAVGLCGFLPLAVRIAASRLAARPGWSVRSLAARLADGRRRLAELRIGDLAVEATFRLGYDQLDPYLARAFRLLSVPETSGVCPPGAAAMLGTTHAEGERVLEALVDLGLMDSPAPGCYRYHDLLWLFARQLPAPDGERGERRAALRRLVRFVLATQRGVHRLVRPGAPISVADPGPSGELEFGGAGEAREWIFYQLTDLLVIVRQAAAAGADGEGAEGTPLAEAADVLLALDPLLEDGYRWEEARPAARAVLDEALRQGDRRAEARARYVLGRALVHTSRLAGARGHAERATALSRETGDRLMLMSALDLLSHIDFYEHDLRAAIGRIEQALELGREFGDRAGEAERTANLAYARVEVGEAAEAVPAAERSRDLARAAGHGAAEAYALYILGIALRELGRLDEAVARFDDGLAICWSQGLRARESYILLRIAETQLLRGRAREALDSAERSLAIGREIGEEYQQGRVLTAIGRILAELGDPGGARRRWEEALELFTALEVAEAGGVRRLLDDAAAASGGLTASP